MKRRKKNNIELLRQEAPIPDIVEQKMEDAFRVIQSREASCETEPAPVRKAFVRRWPVAAAALALCIVTACAAAYTSWSQSLEGKLQITEGQKQMLEENHAWSVLNQPVKSEGVTVTAVECIADSYCAYITFKIKGYELPEGAAPVLKRMEATVEEADPKSLYLYGDFYQEETYDTKGYEILFENDSKDSGYVMDDGSLEYQMRILTMEKGALLGKQVHVALYGMGSRTGQSDPVYDNSGVWEFHWTLQGSANTTQAKLHQTLGDTGTTITCAEISPVSVKFTFERYGSSMWPRLFGFRTRDGSIYLNTAGAGMSRSEDYTKRKFTVINVSTRIMDASRVDALVFTDINYNYKKYDPDMHLYIVPIEGSVSD
ncbi:MAG: DUF4179 domain-containing protein [Eubacterium sp.]|nr:DUF4179 domain-containing protein [Eubacterium sp.]